MKNQMMMAVFNGQKDDVLVLAVAGESIEYEFFVGVPESGCRWDDVLGDMKDKPSFGIWVWKGSVGYYRCGEYDSEIDGPLFDKGEWRKPTKQEIEAILKGEIPWVMSKTKEQWLAEDPTFSKAEERAIDRVFGPGKGD